MDAIDADIVLTAPAHAASLQLIRTVAASAGARFGLSIDDIEDLRIAVTEAGAELIDREPPLPGRTVTLRMSERPNALDVALTVDEGAAGQGSREMESPSPNGRDAAMTPEDSLAWQVLLALVDDLRFIFDGGIGLAFSKHRMDGYGP